MSEKITAIIVEDEEYPRLTLIDKLKVYHPDIYVLDTCDNSDAAIESILKYRPDMLFLDIELPGKDSLWLVNQLKELSSLPLPYIVFTTAYSEPEYLLNAIKLDAVDYLLKPVSLVELAKAIRKVKQKLNEKSSIINNPLGNTFTFRTLNSILKVKESDIVYCEADGSCTSLFLTNENTEISFELLGTIESRICNNGIVRAGRKYIINTRYIFKIDNKRNICYFILPVSGKIVNINLSESGMDIVRKYI